MNAMEAMDMLQSEEEYESSSNEEEEFNECEDINSLTVPRPNHAELMNRLIKDGATVKFSEITAIMGGEEEDENSSSECSQLEKNKISSSLASQSISEASTAISSGPSDSLNANSLEEGKVKRFSKGRGSRLPPTLAALMGQANLCVSSNETDEAIKMCLEIIRQFPNSALPYETLGHIFREMNFHNKALHYQLMAAFNSNDPGKWNELAEEYKEMDELEEAIYCYSRAIKLAPNDLCYHFARIDLVTKLNHQPRLLRCFTHMLKHLKPDQVQVSFVLICLVAIASII